MRSAGVSQRSLERTEQTIVTISHTTAPNRFCSPDIKKVIIPESHVSGKGDIVLATDTLPQLQACHQNRVVHNLQIRDAGKRKLLRQIVPKILASHGIQIRIRYIFTDKHPPIQRGNQGKTIGQ